MHLVEVGEAALGERPEQVQGGRRLVVRLDEALRIGDAGFLGRRGIVGDVAAEGGQHPVADGLGGRGPGFGELAGDAAQLDDRNAGAVGEDDRHLEDDLELVPDGVGGEGVEGLGAVARLQQERAPLSDVAQRGRQPAGLACKHQRGQGGQALQDVVEAALVRPLRLLARGAGAPTARRPGSTHNP